MDINLPHIQGFDLLQMLKRRALWKNISVIIMSTSTSDDDVRHFYNLQGSGFIRKFFQFEEFKENLVQTIQYWNDTMNLPLT